MVSAPRMSMSLLNQIDDDRQVKIWLLSAVNVKDATYYRVAGRFTASGQTWQVNRRYSEFLMLRDTLVKYFSRAMDTCPGCLNYLHAIHSFDFPKKHLFVSKSQLVVNYRVKALRSFINLLASWAFSNTPKCPTCGGFAFDIVRNFVLEGADPVGDASDMNYIRESFVVSTFTEAGRRSSLTRRNSYIPASSSQSLQAQKRSPQPQQRSSTLQRRNTADSIPSMQDDHANSAVYDTFNDYLVRQPSKGGNVRSAINIPLNQHDENQESTVPRPSSTRQPPPPPSSSSSQSQRASVKGPTKPHVSATNPQATPHGPNGSFLFYQDGVDRAHSTASSRPSVPSSTGSKRGILKNWNDVRQDRAQNDSYLSLGASSTDEETKTPGKMRGSVRTRNNARSQNDSYFSLGASSAESRDAEEYGPRASSKRASTPKHTAQVRYDRSQNDSYLSLGGSDSSGEEEFHSHHPSVLPSPTRTQFVQPPVMQKPQAAASQSHGRSAPHSSHRRSSKKAPPPRPVMDDDSSFVSDSFVEPSLRFDGMDPRIVGESDSDDIDIAGVMLDDEPPKRKSVSNQSLWQTWELAKAS